MGSGGFFGMWGGVWAFLLKKILPGEGGYKWIAIVGGRGALADVVWKLL